MWSVVTAATTAAVTVRSSSTELPSLPMADKSIARMRVTEPKAFDLDKCDPGETFGWRKAAAAIELLDVKAELDKLQQRLAAENRRSLLLILQARDAAGKDGKTGPMFSGGTPAGV